MNPLEQFEYPLPVLKVDVEKIVIEAPMAYEGSFNIKNVGGGVLKCKISCNSKTISFSSDEISGNNVNVLYAVNLENYSPGDVIRANALITSNGGEAVIPLIINVTHKALITRDGVEIYSLKEFANYSKREPVAARQLFILNDFTMWLGSIHFEHMEILEHLYADSNTQRALDNFLILSKQKKRAYVETGIKKIEITKKINDSDIITESIPLQKKGWGYIEALSKTEGGAPWLRLLTDRITASAFKDGDEAKLMFQVDKGLIKTKFAREKIIISDGIEISVNVRTEPVLKARLSKTSFENDDSGMICINNNSGKDCLVSLAAKDSYVKLAAKSYFVKEYIEIPFNVKITAIQSAQLSIKKQPVVKTEIYLKTIINDRILKKTLILYIGSFRNRISII